MQKILYYLTLLLFFIQLPLFAKQSKYQYEETVHVPIPEALFSQWKMGYQHAKDHGVAVTRYILKTETMVNWTQMINIQFKDNELIKEKDAVDLMEEEKANNKGVTFTVHTQTPNDVLFEKNFPTKENEIVRMIRTKKGLHRVAYIKKGSWSESEKKQWIERLSKGLIGGKETKKKDEKKK